MLQFSIQDAVHREMVVKQGSHKVNSEVEVVQGIEQYPGWEYCGIAEWLLLPCHCLINPDDLCCHLLSSL